MLQRMREAGMLDSNPTSHTLEIPSLSDYSSDPPPPSEDGGSDDGDEAAPKVKRTKSKGKKSKAKSASSGFLRWSKRWPSRRCLWSFSTG